MRFSRRRTDEDKFEQTMDGWKVRETKTAGIRFPAFIPIDYQQTGVLDQRTLVRRL